MSYKVIFIIVFYCLISCSYKQENRTVADKIDLFKYDIYSLEREIVSSARDEKLRDKFILSQKEKILKFQQFVKTLSNDIDCPIHKNELKEFLVPIHHSIPIEISNYFNIRHNFILSKEPYLAGCMDYGFESFTFFYCESCNIERNNWISKNCHNAKIEFYFPVK